MSARLAPFFSFYGAKHRSAGRYPAPEHDVIVEPFAGSAGYACRYPDRAVVLVERDPVIAALWRFLIAVRPDEVRRIPAAVEDVDTLAVPEHRALVGFWLAKGQAAPARRPSAWCRSGLYARQFWGEAIRERVASQVEAIRHWRVIEGDYTAAPDAVASWFVDPPYQRAGRHYRFGSDGIDFARLGAWCASRRGQVVVCEANGADWLPFEALGSFKSNRRHRFSAEAVWLRETAA
jgi:hypothetical protein